MKKICDSEIVSKYIERYSTNEFFNKDIRLYIELFLFKKGEHICREGDSINYLFSW